MGLLVGLVGWSLIICIGWVVVDAKSFGRFVGKFVGRATDREPRELASWKIMLLFFITFALMTATVGIYGGLPVAAMFLLWYKFFRTAAKISHDAKWAAAAAQVRESGLPRISFHESPRVICEYCKDVKESPSDNDRQTAFHAIKASALGSAPDSLIKDAVQVVCSDCIDKAGAVLVSRLTAATSPGTNA